MRNASKIFHGRKYEKMKSVMKREIYIKGSLKSLRSHLALEIIKGLRKGLKLY
jgi:hypothetical protein